MLRKENENVACCCIFFGSIWRIAVGTAQEHWIKLPMTQMIQPIPIDNSRIVVWNAGTDLGKWSVQSQTVTGGDDACLRFTGELSTIALEEKASRCLMPNGQFLFAMVCQPPAAGVTFRQTVITPQHGPICTKAEN